MKFLAVTKRKIKCLTSTDLRFQIVLGYNWNFHVFIQAYLSGHDKQFGHDLCVRLFGLLDSPPKLGQFVSVMKDVEEICEHQL